MNTHIQFTLVIIISLISQSLLSQLDNTPYALEYVKNAKIASPDVKEFEKHTFLPADLYTGKVKIDIPIYTIKQGNITYPISLFYNGGGIKVDQRSSNIGLGWGITNTVITRDIFGGNDFNDYGNREDIPEDIRFKEYQAAKFGDYGKIGYLKHKSQNIPMRYPYWNDPIDRVDFFPDIYQLYSPGFSTRFYLKDLHQPIELDYQQTKISFSNPTYKTYNYSQLFTNHPFKDIFKFEITSDKGIKYTFNEYTVNYNDVLSYGTGEHTLPEVSSWLITNIYDPTSDSSIKFEYEEYDAGYGTGVINAPDFYPFNLSYASQLQGAGGIGGPCSYLSSFYFNPSDNFQKIKTWQKRLKQVRLRKIKFDLGQIEFIYSNNFRIDDVKEKALRNIVVKDFHGNIIKNFILDNTNYFSSNCLFYDTQLQDCKRLKLDNVIETLSGQEYKLTYYEDSKLPKINSGASDFLGYNNGSIKLSNENSSTMFPKLYFYPNKEEKSLLPFLIPDVPHHIVNKNSVVNKDANNLSNIWSLKSITYPTKGKLELEYESNDFNFWGKDILGGGSRIKSQKLFDANGSIVQSLLYKYKRPDGKSSGTLNRIPFYGYPAKLLFNSYYQDEPDGTTTLLTTYDGLPTWEQDNLEKHFFLYSNSMIEFDVMNGGYIGYEYVTEYEEGNGYTDYQFSSSSEHPDKLSRKDRIHPNLYHGSYESRCMSGFLTANSALGYRLYNDLSKFRGKILKKNIYSQSQNLLFEEENIYNRFIYNDNQIQGIEEYSRDLEHFKLHLLFTSYKNYSSENYLITENKITKYNSNGTSPIIEKINYFYNNSNNLIQQESFESSNLSTIKKLYEYPENHSSIPMYSQLIAENRKSIVIKELITNDNIETKVNLLEYQNYAHNYSPKYLTLLSRMLTGRHSNELEEEIQILEYDEKGNVIRYKNKQGENNYIIMGYNLEYPIMKIYGNDDDDQAYYYYMDMSQSLFNSIGISFLDLQNLSDSENNIEKENEFRDKMRRVQAWLITERNVFVEFYTYDPLIGLTSKTSTNGETTYYEYDTAGRLEFVKDQDGKVIKRMEYHYKN